MPHEIGPEALFILLTQDCDVLHHDYAVEPSIEVHIARPIQEQDGNLLHAKNPRRLQFTTGNQLYEIKMHERCVVPRECLLNHGPDDLVLHNDVIRTIIGWTAKRYLRSAFPDAFNERISGVKGPLRRIESAFKRDGDLVTGIFLRVDPPEEVGPDQQYRVIVRLTAKEEVFEQTGLVDRALALTRTIEKEFDVIPGIEIIDFQLVSEADFSLADLRATMRWDYDYLSHREGTIDDVAPAAT